ATETNEVRSIARTKLLASVANRERLLRQVGDMAHLKLDLQRFPIHRLQESAAKPLMDAYCRPDHCICIRITMVKLHAPNLSERNRSKVPFFTSSASNSNAAVPFRPERGNRRLRRWTQMWRWVGSP